MFFTAPLIIYLLRKFLPADHRIIRFIEDWLPDWPTIKATLRKYCTQVKSALSFTDNLTEFRDNRAVEWLLLIPTWYLILSVTIAKGGTTANMWAVLTLSAVLTFGTAVLTLPSRLISRKGPLYAIISSFFILTLFYTQIENSLVFFIIYEMFLVMSAVILLLCSPNKRTTRSTTYFILWTQAGSMLVLMGFLGHCLVSGNIYFYNWSSENTVSTVLIVLGFGVKVPVFPFFFWLTKTHVEAITSFSIFLSGFLVKLAIFGLFKIQHLITPIVGHGAVNLSLLSIVTATIAFLYQTDYKKIIAYATVQEMGVLLLILLVSNFQKTNIAANLLLIHTLLSAVFFSIADMLFRRYGSRSVHQICGAGLVLPKLTAIIIVCVILFKGLPFTAKFNVELSLYSLIAVGGTGILIAIIMLLVFFGNLVFTVIHFRLIFNTCGVSTSPDLTLRDLSLSFFVITNLTLLVI